MKEYKFKESFEEKCRLSELAYDMKDRIIDIKELDKPLAKIGKLNENNNTDIIEKNEPIENKKEGCRREEEVRAELEKIYSINEGYIIEEEVYLRDKDGKIVRDPITGESRRVDFVIVKDNKAVDSIEVTSKTADKSVQSAKEERIRENGGNYIKDSNGNLIKIPAKISTRIERRD